MILLPLALAGCHVFEVVEIDCASDEPCARPRNTDGETDADTDSDTDADTDTDTDTDVDTAPVVAPVRGWIVSETGTGGNRILVLSPTGSTIASHSELAMTPGAVVYDPVTGASFFSGDGRLYRIGADGAISHATTAFPDVLDLAFADGQVYVATGDALVAWDYVADTTQSAFSDRKSGLMGVGVAPSGVYATDLDSGAPDLYAWSAGSAVGTLYSNYDDSVARARMVFAGPDGAPYTCSTAGAIYAVSQLAEGSGRAVVFYSGGLTDVSACAYDPGDQTWLLFSPTVGVVRLDAQSRAEVVFEPPSSYALVRASFY